ncbi:MAG: hypothetical protein A3G75_09800 [Verrucomicrobia bacterium RIFCSPLOWO2_12_FULL_64_8]|nr:MAG: hypothetical protein A3G75_09800 [Verrucomicrobia bacterium RIFCSPLOWO2_12_FULL_64_8]
MISPVKTLALALTILTLLTPARAVDLAGRWKAEFDTQVGLQKYVYTFKISGEAITGRAAFERTYEKGEVELKEIKLQGEAISFVEPLEFEGQEIRIEYKGKISGDEMKLTRNVGDFATEELVATRVKEAPEKSPPAAPKK